MSKKIYNVFLTVLILFSFDILPLFSASETPIPPEQNWSFNGPFGTWDRASLQRGYQVYKDVCSACHGLKYISYRNLEAIGFSKEEVKALAAEHNVTVINDKGEAEEVPAKPIDKLSSPYPNEEAAKAANGGTAPPDLSLIVNAREHGANYVYAYLMGFEEPPKDFTLFPNLHYNKYFPGHQTAMPAPLTEGQVNYQDGTQATVAQMSWDVVNFLDWAANPKMEERKRMGVMVLLYVIFFTVLMYFVMKRIWSRVK